MGPDEHEEELQVGARRLPDRVRRPGMVVLVALAGLAAAFLTTRLGGDGGGTTSPSPSASPPVPSSAAATSTTGTPTSTDVGGFPLPSVSRVPLCPGGRRCLTTDALPAVTVAALRAQYPGARVQSSRTVTATGGGTGAALLRRSITAVAGERRLQIVVTPFVLGPDDFDRQDSATISRVTVKSSVPGQTVALTLTEPRTARPNDLIVLRLARDPRLAALR